MIAAAFAVAVALPQHLLGAAALAGALKATAFAVDFPVDIDIEVLGDGNERYPVVVRRIADGKEKLTVFDLG